MRASFRLRIPTAALAGRAGHVLIGLLLAGWAAVLAGCTEQAEPGGAAMEGAVVIDTAEVHRHVRRLLEAQVEAWNAGDIEGFMQGYAQTPALRFASGGSVRRGWQEALAAYRSGYPDRAAMGTLRFDSLDIRPLAPRYALVFGRWRLQRAEDAPHGLFTLLVERRPPTDSAASDSAATWRIVHDHTSAAQ